MIRCRRTSTSLGRRPLALWLALSTTATPRILRGFDSRGAGTVEAYCFSSIAALALLPRHRRILQDVLIPTPPRLHGLRLLPTTSTTARTGRSVIRREFTDSARGIMDVAAPAASRTWEPLPPSSEVDESRWRRRRHHLRQGVSLEMAADGEQPAGRPDEEDRPTRRRSLGERGKNRRGKKSSDGDASDSTLKRKKNRPGHNSYLKVVLVDDTLDRLHGAVSRIRDRVRQMEDDRIFTTSTDGTVEETATPASSGTPRSGKSTAEFTDSPRLVTVKPRSRELLHMTLFFGGEVLCDLSEEELVKFHGDVSSALLGRQEAPHFVQQESNPADVKHHGRGVEVASAEGARPAGDAATSSTIASRDEECGGTLREGFRLVKLCLFPPRRNNLIVAVFDPPEGWRDVHGSLRDAALRSGSARLRDVAALSSGGPHWVPHVTLANLVVDKQPRNRHQVAPDWTSRLQELLEEETQRLLGTPIDSEGERSRDETPCPVGQARCIAMGGPVPGQVELDWTFRCAVPLASPATN